MLEINLISEKKELHLIQENIKVGEIDKLIFEEHNQGFFITNLTEDKYKEQHNITYFNLSFEQFEELVNKLSMILNYKQIQIT